MELKIIKQPLAVNEILYRGKNEIPFDEDFTLPDFCPDIMKILKCLAKARITSKYINGNNILVDGHINLNLLYCDKKGCLYNYEHVFPFSKTIETENDLSAAIVSFKIKNEFINCRAVTERKMSVHGAFMLFTKVKVKKQYEIIADVDESSVQLNRKSFPALNSVGSAEKNLLVEEELVLTDGQQPIESIIRYDGSAVVSEIGVVRGKLSLQGIFSICVLYSSPSKQHLLYKSTVPFSAMLDIAGLDENCICTGKAQLCFLEIRPKQSGDECRAMNLNAKLNISAESFCNSEVAVIFDAYSTKRDINIKKTPVNLEKVVGHIGDNFMFKKNIQYTDCSIASVIDSWSETEITEETFENGVITVKGSINLCILVVDNDEKVCFLEKKSDFVYSKEYSAEIEGKMHLSADFEPITTSYTITSQDCLEYRIEYRVNLSLKEERNVNLITELNMEKENEKKEKDDSSMILYFANKGEKVWDIAKIYGADVKEMTTLNSIKDETIEFPKCILIPM